MEVFMNFINAMFGSILSLDPVSAVKMVVMWAIGGTLIYLAIKKDMEPSLLLPMGFGAILVNLPLSGAIDQMHELGIEVGALSELFRAGISNELFPLLLFIGIGAMIDFGPLLALSLIHISVGKRQKHFLFKFPIKFHLFIVHLNFVNIVYSFRHFDIIRSFHRNTYIRYFLIYPFFCINQRLV